MDAVFTRKQSPQAEQNRNMVLTIPIIYFNDFVIIMSFKKEKPMSGRKAEP